MHLTPLQKRAERNSRNKTGLDMNLVSLIDIFTILIFFLMSSAAGVEILTPGKGVSLPQSSADKAPKETLVITVSGPDILVEGRRVATVNEALAAEGDLIAGLKEELDLQAKRVVIRTESQAQGKAITIMGDKTLPYALLRKVMVTAARADFSEVSFAVTPKAVKT
ncbi:MAG: biopolymer transporter ExbD [Burkholderiaceae bacterium]|nr:biopolymer transporter ExbD [Burkholderiaceae bacterium]